MTRSLKLGKLPPKQAPALKLARLLTGVVPAHPASVDNLDKLSNWQMLGNDRAGDCVAVTWANMRRLVSYVLGGAEHYPAIDYVWKVYQTQNPDFDPNSSTNGPGSDADRGMDIQTLLEYLVKVGGPDGTKAVAFAAVDYRNRDEVDAAIAIFGSLWTGIVVRANNDQDFQAGRPWDYDASSSDEGGHSIIVGGYHGALADDERMITWAAETGFTQAFEKHQVDEMWVVIWPEHFEQRSFLEGVDQAALAAAYQQITGKPLNVPPGPNPAPTPPASDLAAAVARFRDATHHWAVDERHSGDNKAAAAAARALYVAAGLS